MNQDRAKMLPNLLYVGDVPVCATTAGSVQLHRLLCEYPPEKLQIWESNLLVERGERLPGVQYASFSMCIRRLMRTRFRKAYSTWLFRHSRRHGRAIARTMRRQAWRPEAVLSVAHGFSWLAAAEVAERLDIPLHLIVHDDPFGGAGVGAEVMDEFMGEFGKVYCAARSRLCVSPYMAEKYESIYGVPGDVLFPARGPGAKTYDEPDKHVSEGPKSLLFAYAGTLHVGGYKKLLAALAEVLDQSGHRLLIFSNLDPASVESSGLKRANVDARPMAPFAEFSRTLREDVDALFVPMSFSPVDRRNMEISFPSKLTDYTVAGVPLVICGPEYCSAAHWSKDNGNVADVITSPEAGDLAAAVKRLEDVGYRMRLAKAALNVGNEYFSHRRAVDLLYQRFCGQAAAPAAVERHQEIAVPTEATRT